MSLAANIRRLYQAGWQQCEIIRVTGCSERYFTSVISRACAPDEETRKRRVGSPQKGTPRYRAARASDNARRRALARGLPPAEAKRIASAAYSKVIEETSTHEHT